MSKLFKFTALGIFALIFAICLPLFAVTLVTPSVAEAQEQTGFIENGDFEAEFGENGWGINNSSLQRVKDTDDNYVGSMPVSAGWLNVRLWKSTSNFVGKTFVLSFKMKINSTEAVNGNQFLFDTSIDDDQALASGSYFGGWGDGGKLTTNQWNTVTYYFSFVANEDGTVTLKGGTTKDCADKSYTTVKAPTSHVDFKIGAGAWDSNITAWYFDDVSVVEYKEPEPNSAVMNNLTEDGKGSFDEAWVGTNSGRPEIVADPAGVEGNNVGKFTSAATLLSRTWNAYYMTGHRFKVSLDLYIENSTAAYNATQFVVKVAANDWAFLPAMDVFGMFEKNTIPTNQWVTKSFYIDIADNLDGTFTVSVGESYSDFVAGYTYSAVSAEGVALSYFDVAIYCGAFNDTAWYVDNFSLTHVKALGANEFANGDFEAEFETNKWGMNASGSRYYDEAIGSNVLKNNTAAWIKNRLWAGAGYMQAGKIYRISYDVKVDLPESGTYAGINLVNGVKANDIESLIVYPVTNKISDFNSYVNWQNIDLANKYALCGYYLAFFEEADGTLGVYTGESKEGLTKAYTLDKATLSHIDLQIGFAGEGFTWYVDNFYCVDVTPIAKAYDTAITVTDTEGNAVEGFTYALEGTYESASVSGNVISVISCEGEVKYSISKDGYVTATGTVNEGATATTVTMELVPVETYQATITVVYEDGSEATGFTYTVAGTGEASVMGNVITVVKCEETLTYTVSKEGYDTVTGTVTEENATVTVTLKPRTYVADTTDATGNMLGYYGFDNSEVGTELVQILSFNGWEIFINGNFATDPIGAKVTNADSLYGPNSLYVKNYTDRFVTRLIGTFPQLQQSKVNTEYHFSYYLKAVNEAITITPCINLGFFTTDSTQWADGWGPNANSANINLAEPVTLSTTEWTRVDLSFSYYFEGSTVYFLCNGMEHIVEYTGGEVINIGYIDLSISGQGEFYMDNVALFEEYDAEIAVLGNNNEKVEATLTFTDYAGATINVDSEYVDGVYKVKGLYGNVKVEASYEGKPYSAVLSKTFNVVTLADPYNANVTVKNYDGTAVSPDDVIEVFAMDGGARIEGLWDEANGYYYFNDVMSDIVIYVYVSGAQQHLSVVATRNNESVVYYVAYAANPSEGLLGNTANYGGADKASDMVQGINPTYAYPGVGTSGAEGKYLSFGPIVSPSEESLTGDGSIRMDSSARILAEDNDVYAQYLEDNDLDADTNFGDRVGFRGTNAYSTEGVEYAYTTYVKVPEGRGTTTFSFIFLVSNVLNNTGSFNLWRAETVTATEDRWEKLEFRFSFNVVDDDAANASGKYENERWAMVYTYAFYQNDVLKYSAAATYGYEVYSKGQYYFYSFNEEGNGLVGWAGQEVGENVYPDSTSDGGASFGQFSSIEPSYQLLDGTSLLIDATTMTSKYDAKVTVLNRDLTTNANVKYLKMVDLYTGEIFYVAGSDAYNAETGTYVIKDLFRAYEVYACDENKNVIEGVVGQTVSSENNEGILEYEYSVTITVVDQNGNSVTDLDIRVILANLSNVSMTNNGDGTYSISGLTGIRSLNLRKQAGSENSYEYPKNVTVSSADAVKTLTVVLKTEEPDPNTGSSDTTSSSSKGCVSGISGTALAISLCFGALLLKKKRD